jgi:uncharacterized membrane protein YecN with MAPEG domain
MATSFDVDINAKWCIFAWISAVLIWKNIILVGILTVFRLDEDVRIPEDATAFGRQRRVANQTKSNDYVITNEEWNITNRIGKVLGNETEYVTYFLVLFLAFVLVRETTTTRQLVYGCIFVVARYVHNSGLIFRNSYARIIGFLFSVLILSIMTLDLAISTSIQVAEHYPDSILF